MKSVSIVALFALVALCASIPVVEQSAATDLQARVDIYNDFLSGLFSNLVSTTFGSVSNFLNQLIAENPLGVGKRSAEDELATRISIFSFLYDNILQDFFSGLVTNTFGTISGTLNNLIETNPLGIGKRSAENDLAARISIFSFLYDNILSDFFSGLVTNTFSTATNALTNLIQTNPLGVGKREVTGDLTARISALSFFYDNILQDLFSGLVSNTFGTISGTLNNLIQTNPLGWGKREISQSRVDALSFLYDNILQDFFSGLVSNTFGTITSTLTNLIQTNPLGWGKRSLNVAEQFQGILAPIAASLAQKLKSFAHQALALWNNRPQLAQLVNDTVAEIKAIIATVAQQLSQVIPAEITNQLTQVLAGVQSMLIFWTSGLAGSLGPVLGVLHA